MSYTQDTKFNILFLLCKQFFVLGIREAQNGRHNLSQSKIYMHFYFSCMMQILENCINFSKWNGYIHLCSVQFSSVVQSCPTLCNPMNRSTPGLPVHHYSQSLLKLMSIESVMPSSHHILYRPLLPPSIFPSIGSFQMNQFFTTGSLSIGVSASKSDLPMNIQDWFPLGWTNWISLQSKGLSRVFSNTTVQKHQFFGVSFLYSPTLTSIHDSWKNHRFD